MCPGIAAGLVAVRIVIAIVEADISSSTLDRRTPTCGGPDDGPCDLGLPAEEPHWWVQREIEKIVAVDRLNTILAVRPPRPARPLSGTVAAFAPSASSSRQADSLLRGSRRHGREIRKKNGGVQRVH
jgi:hypothetical protein